MKVKLIIWADVSAEEYAQATTVKDELNLVAENVVYIETNPYLTRAEWEADGLEWDEEEGED